ncbi:dienelactone hydrolase family protein [Caballeronia sp. HLA56]
MKLAAGTPLLVGVKGRAEPARSVLPDQTMQKLRFSSYLFSDESYEHVVYVKGTGPDVIVMHELPGFDEHTVRFIDRLSEAGFRVHAPHLFGPMLWEAPNLNYARLCISKEFGHLKANQSAPVCDWLRALARSLGEENPSARIGVIGMCLTGAFVIPMVIEPNVRAGVVSQPAIPLSLRYSVFRTGEGEWMHQVNVSDEDFQAATQRSKRDAVPLVIQRFTHDQISLHPRVERIKQAFGENATLDEYADPRPMDNERDFPHALLTKEYDLAKFEQANEADNSTRIAFTKVVDFLRRNLSSSTV